MKRLSHIAVTAAVLLCGFTQVSAQANHRRNVHFNFIGKDSIKLAYNEDFDLIEDSCSQATRFAHYNMQMHKFIGPVKDVSRLDPKIILTEGTYGANGTKEGPFITRYINGQVQAKGNFANNNFDGHWDLYYDDGKPKLSFDAKDNGKDITITDAWDAAGKKLVDNGKGKYNTTTSGLTWEGHLLAGKPEGSWDVYRTDDITKNPMATEKYKGGIFQRGRSPIGEYTDAPHMVLISPAMLPFVRAEALKISARSCDDGPAKHIVYVQYKEGMDNYSQALINIVSSVFRRIDLKHFSNGFDIEGEVNDLGFLINLSSVNSFNQEVSDALIYGLKQAPALEAASINGHKVNEKVKFNFKFSEGLYTFNYRFGEVIDRSGEIAKK